jgi:hypothetical protein
MVNAKPTTVFVALNANSVPNLATPPCTIHTAIVQTPFTTICSHHLSPLAYTILKHTKSHRQCYPRAISWTLYVLHIVLLMCFNMVNAKFATVFVALNANGVPNLAAPPCTIHTAIVQAPFTTICSHDLSPLPDWSALLKLSIKDSNLLPRTTYSVPVSVRLMCFNMIIAFSYNRYAMNLQACYMTWIIQECILTILKHTTKKVKTPDSYNLKWQCASIW